MTGASGGWRGAETCCGSGATGDSLDGLATGSGAGGTTGSLDKEVYKHTV